jgi:endoglucanase
MKRGTRRQLAAALAAAGSAAVLAAGGLLLPIATAAGAAATPGAAPAQGVGAGYWHTSGNQILDSNGNPVRIAGRPA